ncbi:PEP-CTERM sorting domain-containing protein [Phragmitibacter flavus]|uniref:PEP-CTERM sorting domain-containing protein n=1 Tax=Phragmitibacter flavus TaxID=2576071 RepID=A0A5R8KFJ5_9BACT|nr:PEP-CTERM sorting domain-containing protein [Phragmitibacter flavus]TLD71082.1 PEP-CTERM sorting domain-containing protein [Phragmitibacter flavus]
MRASNHSDSKAPRRTIFAILASALLSTPLTAAVSLASGNYTENFNAALDPNAWTLSNVGVRAYTDGGRPNVTVAAAGGDGLVSGTAPAGTNIGDILTSIKPAGSYASLGFSGSWLTNNSAPAGPVNGDLTFTRTATLSFDSLGTHSQIDSISFLLAAGDSIDGVEGVFEVLLDGNVIFRRDFESGGTLRTSGFSTGFEDVGTGITPLATAANLLGAGFYRETWSAGATTTANRFAESWTVESAYQINLQNIAHSSDTLYLQFVWRGFNSDFSDEFLAIDNLAVSVPEPSRFLLLCSSLGLILMRRRRH